MIKMFRVALSIMIFISFSGKAQYVPDEKTTKYKVESKDKIDGSTEMKITEQNNSYENPQIRTPLDFSAIYNKTYKMPSGERGGYAANGIAIHNEQKEKIGIKDLGGGLHVAHFVGKNYYEKPSKVRAKCVEMVQNEAHRLATGQYEIVNEISEDRSYPYVLAKTTLFFQVINSETGEVVLSEADIRKRQQHKEEQKKQARAELVELKKMLDMGILTEEEFASKSDELKKIILQ
jgi:hypothetical protein